MHENQWTFKKWIANFESVNLPIGDLSKDISSDKDFPISDDFQVIYDYIRHKSSSDSALETFVAVWNFYTASR